MTLPSTPSVPSVSPIDAAVTNMFDQAHLHWSDMLKRNNLNRKTVNDAQTQVLQTLANAVEICSSFMDSETATSLTNKKIGDFIGISLYFDEFGTVNPLGQSSATNKIMGCYFRVNNFPIELQDTDLIFLGFLALAIDVKQEDFQELLKNLLLPQLHDLENGIDVPYKGEMKKMPVILLNLLGDNLGIHQCSGYTTYFAGDVSCRLCYGTAADLKLKWALNEFQLKTAENYDRITDRNDCVGLEGHGIKYYCTFNRLEHFHVVDATCVDMMHDLMEGHLKRLLIYIIRSIVNDNATPTTLEDINNAITSFPCAGELARNKPQKFFLDHVRKGEIKQSTAKSILNITLYLPLILNQAHIAVTTTNNWYKLYLYFLGILDILLMPNIPKDRLPRLQIQIQTYLKHYIQYGGHMTVKPHLTLHYADVIKRFGSLIHSWSMAFEAKHKAFKEYERNNKNHKDLAMTLAQRIQEQNVPLYENMANGNFLVFIN
uniref:Uncharacterized protein n=1 Tax=Panagrolaimus superbus TaxID=310955 RepID=A0A914Z5F8_9BILA